MRVERRAIDPRAVLRRARASSLPPDPEVRPIRASRGVEKRDSGVSGRGSLVAEICAGLDHVRGRFPKLLWLGGSL